MTAPQRSLLVLPSYATWSPAEQAALSSLDEMAVRLVELTAGSSDGGLASGLPSAEAAETLQHPLSPMFPVPHQADLQRSRMEWEVLKRHFDALAGMAAGEPVEGVVRKVAQDVTGSGDFRRTRAQTAADRTGRYFRYPASSGIPCRLAELAEMFASKADRPAAFDAVVALVAISNLHPFCDGNGRVARVVFNGLLQRRHAGPTCYLPLHPLALLSRGGFIVRIRLAETGGDWLPLLQFLTAAAMLWQATLLERQSTAGLRSA